MRRRKMWALGRRIAMVVLMVVILLRPTLMNEPTERRMTNLNVWFVVDATGSMVAKDVDGGARRRFEQVQDDIKTIVTELPGAKYGMLAQDFSSYAAAPMTLSADAIVAATSYAKPKYSLYAGASDLSDLLEYAARRIAQYKERYPERKNVVVLMSDGEDVSGREVTVPSELRDVVDVAAVFGYGSEAGSVLEYIGGSIKSEDGTSHYNTYEINPDRFVTYYGSNESVEVDKERRVVSKIDEGNLRLIATALGAGYYHRESGEVPKEMIGQMVGLATVVGAPEGSETNTGAELYWVFAAMLLALMLWDGEEVVKNLMAEREK